MELNRIFLRLKAYWRVKALLSICVTSGFTAVYVLLQWYPQFPVREMMPRWIDRAIPFVPGAVYPYQSLWLMMPISLWLMETKDDLRRYGKTFFLITLASFGAFFFFPTSVSRPAFAEGSYGYAILISFDKSLNAFPSLHAALAVFAASCCHAVFRKGARRRAVCSFIWAWAFVILASTLLTKQHVVADVVAGVSLGFGAYALCGKSRFTSRGLSCDEQ